MVKRRQKVSPPEKTQPETVESVGTENKKEEETEEQSTESIPETEESTSDQLNDSVEELTVHSEAKPENETSSDDRDKADNNETAIIEDENVDLIRDEANEDDGNEDDSEAHLIEEGSQTEDKVDKDEVLIEDKTEEDQDNNKNDNEGRAVEEESKTANDAVDKNEASTESCQKDKNDDLDFNADTDDLDFEPDEDEETLKDKVDSSEGAIDGKADSEVQEDDDVIYLSGTEEFDEFEEEADKNKEDCASKDPEKTSKSNESSKSDKTRSTKKTNDSRKSPRKRISPPRRSKSPAKNKKIPPSGRSRSSSIEIISDVPVSGSPRRGRSARRSRTKRSRSRSRGAYRRPSFSRSPSPRCTPSELRQIRHNRNIASERKRRVQDDIWALQDSLREWEPPRNDQVKSRLGPRGGGYEPPKPSGPPGFKLVVRNFPPTMSESEFYSMFVRKGELVSCEKKKNVGFVVFKQKVAAENAVKTLNGTQNGNKKLQVQMQFDAAPPAKRANFGPSDGGGRRDVRDARDALGGRPGLMDGEFGRRDISGDRDRGSVRMDNRVNLRGSHAFAEGPMRNRDFEDRMDTYSDSRGGPQPFDAYRGQERFGKGQPMGGGREFAGGNLMDLDRNFAGSNPNAFGDHARGSGRDGPGMEGMRESRGSSYGFDRNVEERGSRFDDDMNRDWRSRDPESRFEDMRSRDPELLEDMNRDRRSRDNELMSMESSRGNYGGDINSRMDSFNRPMMGSRGDNFDGPEGLMGAGDRGRLGVRDRDSDMFDLDRSHDLRNEEEDYMMSKGQKWGGGGFSSSLDSGPNRFGGGSFDTGARGGLGGGGVDPYSELSEMGGGGGNARGMGTQRDDLHGFQGNTRGNSMGIMSAMNKASSIINTQFGGGLANFSTSFNSGGGGGIGSMGASGMGGMAASGLGGPDKDLRTSGFGVTGVGAASQGWGGSPTLPSSGGGATWSSGTGKRRY